MLKKADGIFAAWNEKHPLRTKTVAVVLAAVLFLCLIPSLYVGRYIAPQADDYGFSAPTHNVWEATHSFGAVVAAAAQESARLYRTWQGSYSACFLMCLQPGFFGEGLYSLVPWLLMGSWLLCSLYFCRGLAQWLGAGRVDGVLLTCALLLLQLLLLPYPNESWYWFNGAVYYTFYYSVSLFLLGLLLRSRLCRTAGGALGYGAAFVLLGVFLGGGPFSVILVDLFVLGVTAAVSLRRKLRVRFAQLAGFAALAVGFAFNALCPGNDIRALEFPDTPDAVHAIYLAIVNALIQMQRWTNFVVVLAVLLLVPALWRLGGGAPLSFRRPLLATVLSFGLYAMMLCPPIYGMGNTGPQRLTNVMFFCFLWLILFNVFYWLGWVRHRTAWGMDAARAMWQFLSQWGTAVFLCSAFVFLASFTVGLYRENTPVSALKIALNGEAQTYYAELTSRTALYEDESITDVVVPELTVKPFPIYHDDLSDNPTYFANGDVAIYYGKRSVTLQFREG